MQVYGATKEDRDALMQENHLLQENMELLREKLMKVINSNDFVSDIWGAVRSAAAA